MKLFAFFKSLTKENKDVTKYYSEINKDIVPTLKGHSHKDWLNVGFWKSARNYNDACRDLAQLVSRKARFKSQDRVLDVGCGLGEQDIFWSQRYKDIHITAIDLTPMHVKRAQEKIQNLQNAAIQFAIGNAADLAYDKNTFDKVVAVDCAYHFNTRKQFIKEAYRVLKPGGILVVTDMLPKEGCNINLPWQRMGRKNLYIPTENMYDIKEYTRYLKQTGFSRVEVTNIKHEVFTGLAKYFVTRLIQPKKGIDDVCIKIKPSDFKKRLYPKIWEWCFGTSEYVMIRAEK